MGFVTSEKINKNNTFMKIIELDSRSGNDYNTCLYNCLFFWLIRLDKLEDKIKSADELKKLLIVVSFEIFEKSETIQTIIPGETIDEKRVNLFEMSNRGELGENVILYAFCYRYKLYVQVVMDTIKEYYVLYHYNLAHMTQPEQAVRIYLKNNHYRAFEFTNKKQADNHDENDFGMNSKELEMQILLMNKYLDK
jgi:hypothetical protein